MYFDILRFRMLKSPNDLIEVVSLFYTCSLPLIISFWFITQYKSYNICYKLFVCRKLKRAPWLNFLGILRP